MAPGDDPVAVIPGWYGKLASLGDFASRRLPAEFVTVWDGWLQHVLQGVQDAIGPAWLQSYLTAPIWRFAILPGLVGPSAWAGIIMPSVDRVGRYFPLTVAAELASAGALAHAVFGGTAWFAGLEEAALGMLATERGPDDLDASLARLPLPAPHVDAADESVGSMQPLPSIDAFEATARARALTAWSTHGRWRALWWTRGRVDGDPQMVLSAALPSVKEFAQLLDSGISPVVPRSVSA